MRDADDTELSEAELEAATAPGGQRPTEDSPPSDVVPTDAPGENAAPDAGPGGDAPTETVAVRKTVEEWATEKGFLPSMFPGSPPHQNGQRVIPGTGPKPNPKYERFFAAKCGKGWVVGVELTEAEFDEAMTLIDQPI